MEVRTKEGIALVLRPGYRFRQYLGDLATAKDLFSSAHEGYGALCVFDDVVLDAGATASFLAHDGLETVAYVLEGTCHIAHDGSPPVELGPGTAARILGGHGARYEGRNHTTSPVRVILVAFVAPQAHAQAPFSTASFAPDALALTWIATPAGEDHEPTSLAVGASVSFGLASLDAGEKIRLPPAVDRGLYLAVLDGNIETDSGFLDEGSDAKVRIESRGVSLQGVSAATVAVVEVHLGFVQEIF